MLQDLENVITKCDTKTLQIIFCDGKAFSIVMNHIKLCILICPTSFIEKVVAFNEVHLHEATLNQFFSKNCLYNMNKWTILLNIYQYCLYLFDILVHESTFV